MKLLPTRIRITAGLVSLLVSVLLLGVLLNVVPDRHGAVIAGRQALCEAIAVNGSQLVSQSDVKRLETVLRSHRWSEIRISCRLACASQRGLAGRYRGPSSATGSERVLIVPRTRKCRCRSGRAKASGARLNCGFRPIDGSGFVQTLIGSSGRMVALRGRGKLLVVLVLSHRRL